MDGRGYGVSHPLDVERAQAAVSDDNRYTRLRESMHKQLEERAKKIELIPLGAMDVLVDFMCYHQHMLTELLTTAVPPGDAVQQIYMQGRIEQTRVLAQELATSAALRRAKNAETKREE